MMLSDLDRSKVYISLDDYRSFNAGDLVLMKIVNNPLRCLVTSENPHKHPVVWVFCYPEFNNHFKLLTKDELNIKDILE